MKNIRSVYPDLVQEENENGHFYGPGNYDDLVESMGYLTILVVHDSDYQGDSRYLLQAGEQIGWLQFGWGSCSGCDALQACSSFDEIEKLRAGLHDSITWFPNAAKAKVFFETHDWEGDYSWREEKQKEFVAKAINCLTDIGQ